MVNGFDKKIPAIPIFNSKTIRQFRSKLITLVYTVKGERHMQVGEITTTTSTSFEFQIVEYDHPIPITYGQIIDIQEPVKD